MTKWQNKLARADLAHVVYGFEGMTYDECRFAIDKVARDESFHIGKCHGCGETANGFGWAQGKLGPAVVGALCYKCGDHDQPDGWPAVGLPFYEIWRTVARVEPPPTVRDDDCDKIFWTRTFDPASGVLGPNERRVVGRSTVTTRRPVARAPAGHTLQ